VARGARQGFILSEPHAPDCFCLAKKKDDFVVYDGWESRDRIGRKNSGVCWWHRFKCNDPDCPAVALVRWDVLKEFVSKGLKAAG